MTDSIKSSSSKSKKTDDETKKSIKATSSKSTKTKSVAKNTVSADKKEVKKSVAKKTPNKSKSTTNSTKVATATTATTATTSNIDVDQVVNNVVNSNDKNEQTYSKANTNNSSKDTYEDLFNDQQNTNEVNDDLNDESIHSDKLDNDDYLKYLGGQVDLDQLQSILADLSKEISYLFDDDQDDEKSKFEKFKEKISSKFKKDNSADSNVDEHEPLDPMSSIFKDFEAEFKKIFNTYKKGFFILGFVYITCLFITIFFKKK